MYMRYIRTCTYMYMRYSTYTINTTQVMTVCVLYIQAQKSVELSIQKLRLLQMSLDNRLEEFPTLADKGQENGEIPPVLPKPAQLTGQSCSVCLFDCTHTPPTCTCTYMYLTGFLSGGMGKKCPLGTCTEYFIKRTDSTCIYMFLPPPHSPPSPPPPPQIT